MEGDQRVVPEQRGLVQETSTVNLKNAGFWNFDQTSKKQILQKQRVEMFSGKLDL